MVNRLPRSPGEFARSTIAGRVGGVPDAAVPPGTEAADALAAIGSGLSRKIGAMADDAAAREGADAGMSAGARAGQKFLEKMATDARGEARGASAATPAATPAMAAAGASPLDGTPLQLRRNGTVRGEAFDAAAIKSYGWRMQQGLVTDLGAAYEQNQDSPGGYEKAIATIAEKYGRDPLLQQGPLKEVFDQTLSEKVSVGRLSIAARHEANLRAAAKAAAVDGLDAIRAGIERDAYNVGGNPAGDGPLTAQLARTERQIDGLVTDGTLSADDGARQKKALRNTVFAARMDGTFDALPNPEQQADFALGFMDRWAAGEFPDISLADAQATSNGLYAKAVRNQSAVTSERKAMEGQLATQVDDDIASIAATGEGLDPRTSGLTPDKVETLLGTAALDDWRARQATAQKAWEATAGMEAETSADIAARLATLAPTPGQEGFAGQQAIYEAAQAQAAAVMAERQTDPLGQADRAHLVTLAPIDTSSPEALAQSLGNRRQAAETVARQYGTPVTVFRPSEQTALAQAFHDNPDLLPGFATAAKATLGELAPHALSEIGTAGPEVAHAAGIALATGDPSVAQDLAEALKAKAAKSFKAKMPAQSQMTDAAGAILGPALAATPDGLYAVMGTANLLFEYDANRLGFDPSEIAKPGSPANAAYSRAIERAVGGRRIAGVRYGGIVDVNGRQTIAPSAMPAEQFPGLLDDMADEDLGELPPIAAGNGVPVRAADVRGGHLVAVGDGLYRVAIGDPDGFDPQYLVTPGGDYWVLDIGRLADVEVARANAVAAARSPSAPPAGLPTWMPPGVGVSGARQ